MLRRWPLLLLALAGLAACKHAPRLEGSHSDAGGAAGTDGGADLAADLASVDAPAADDATPAVPEVGGSDAVDLDGVVRPFNTCDELSRSLFSQCLGCHTLAGPPNPRYPDLYAYTRTAADFLAKVREGGGLMPAYGYNLISDGDVVRAFDRFTMTKRPSLDDVANTGPVQPLFAPADAVFPAIVTHRDDGAIVTRGAGRLHARHENEQAYVPYLQSYWEKQSYAFVIEDFTATATKHFVVTYLPSYTPYMTNYKAWKASGDNAVFLETVYMPQVDAAPTVVSTAPVGGIFQLDETTVPPDRSLTQGQNLELELGVIKDPTRVMNPFSDVIRYRIGVGGLTPDSPDRASFFPPLDGPVPEARNGGDTTIPWLKLGQDAYFDQMALDTQQENVQPFLEGRRLFYTDFVTGNNVEAGQPPFPEQAGKAGPRASATACASCHPKNGRGPAIAGATVSKQVTLGDGRVVTLTRPAVSARIAPPLLGLGLLEAIDQRTLLLGADRLDCNQDGISGRANFVMDPTGILRVGRFGWKAEKASVRAQVAGDAAGMLDVSTSVSPDANGKAALSDQDLARLTTLMRLGGVPPQRSATDPQVQAGALLFQTLRCSGCHWTDVLTSPDHPLAELRGQAIRPYTDLLLHDMGPDLMDGGGVPTSTTADAPPSASEWRTPPLWGVGLRATVNGNAGLLHDGRAATVEEAILWHGGEATKVVSFYKALSATERAALLAFVDSL
jgi:CxxC motif-containing protein (DUF1111 family)